MRFVNITIFYPNMMGNCTYKCKNNNHEESDISCKYSLRSRNIYECKSCYIDNSNIKYLPNEIIAAEILACKFNTQHKLKVRRSDRIAAKKNKIVPDC